MPIRRAKSSDFPIIVEILTHAFWDESFVSEFLHPKRDEHPNDLKGYWRRHLRPDWYNTQYHFLVATDPATNAVVGVANWKQDIPRPPQGVFAKSFTHFLDFYVSALNAIDARVFPDRAVDLTRTTAYIAAVPYFSHYWSGERERNWSLETLGVRPGFQRKGYGRELVEWGMERAEEEGVAVSVVCSEGTEAFYKKCGFEVEVGSVTTGDGNPLASVKGGAILFRDARSRDDGEGKG